MYVTATPNTLCAPIEPKTPNVSNLFNNSNIKLVAHMGHFDQRAVEHGFPHAGALDPMGGRDFHMWLPLGGQGFPHVGKGISKLLGAAGARDFHWKFPTHSIRGGWGSQLITTLQLHINNCLLLAHFFYEDGRNLIMKYIT